MEQKFILTSITEDGEVEHLDAGEGSYLLETIDEDGVVFSNF